MPLRSEASCSHTTHITESKNTYVLCVFLLVCLTLRNFQQKLILLEGISPSQNARRRRLGLIRLTSFDSYGVEAGTIGKRRIQFLASGARTPTRLPYTLVGTIAA
jgi:hypothetical protein